MSTSTKEYVILSNYKMVKETGPLTHTERFSLTLSLPSGTSIVSARLKWYIHCDRSEKWLFGLIPDGATNSGVQIYMSYQGNTSDMREIMKNWNMYACNTLDDSQDVTSFVIPREGPNEGTNYFDVTIGTFNWGEYCEYTISLSLIVEYSGSEPTLTYQKVSVQEAPQQYVAFKDVMSSVVLIVEVFILLLVFSVVTSIIGAVRELGK
jgi:hypothetical protein